MSRELAAWSAMAFRAIGLDETEAETRLRRAACLLTDIGWRAHPEYRGEQSLNLIANAAFIGIDHPGRAYLALANFYRHEGLIDEQLSPRIRELVSTRLMERARALGATLRVAHLSVGGDAGRGQPHPPRAARQDAGAGAARRTWPRSAERACCAVWPRSPRFAGLEPAIVAE